MKEKNEGGHRACCRCLLLFTFGSTYCHWHILGAWHLWHVISINCSTVSNTLIPLITCCECCDGAIRLLTINIEGNTLLENAWRSHYHLQRWMLRERSQQCRRCLWVAWCGVFGWWINYRASGALWVNWWALRLLAHGRQWNSWSHRLSMHHMPLVPYAPSASPCPCEWYTCHTCGSTW